MSHQRSQWTANCFTVLTGMPEIVSITPQSEHDSCCTCLRSLPASTAVTWVGCLVVFSGVYVFVVLFVCLFVLTISQKTDAAGITKLDTDMVESW